MIFRIRKHEPYPMQEFAQVAQLIRGEAELQARYV